MEPLYSASILALHWYLYYNMGSTYHMWYIGYKGVMGCAHLSSSTPPTLKSGA